MITLRKITLENRRQVFNLEVSDEQRQFVASNLSSVATAYVLATNGGHPLPFAIYHDEIAVGFILIAYGITSYDLPKIAEGNYTIIRFMIDKRYQNQGFGKEALYKALEYVRTFPEGKAKYCWLGYSPENKVAERLYKKVGFSDNGEIINDEVIASIEL
jgi:diamine N-acetyltransferase